MSLSLGSLRRGVASYKRPASNGAPIVRKRPTRGAIQFVAQDDLEAYADFGRSCLAEGLGYKAIRTRLENEHGVTAAHGTMQRWVAALNGCEGAMPKKRRATMTACASKNIEELWVYDEWAQGKLSEDEGLTYRGLRRLLEVEHGVTAANGTMQRWLKSLSEGRPAIPRGRRGIPRKRPASMMAMPCKSIEELQPYDEWARAKLAADEELTYRGLRRLLELDHGVTAANDTMGRWLKAMKSPSKRQVYGREWIEEDSKTFGSRYARQTAMTTDGLDGRDNVHYYQTHGSWSYCAECGRRRFGAAKVPPLSGRYAAPAKSNCRHCPLSWEQLEQEAAKAVDTDRLFVSPQSSDWPRYDPDQEVFRLDGDAGHLSLLDLSAEEASSLAPLKLFCDFKALRGQSGNAPVANLKKLSVIRAEWNPIPVEAAVGTQRL